MKCMSYPESSAKHPIKRIFFQSVSSFVSKSERVFQTANSLIQSSQRSMTTDQQYHMVNLDSFLGHGFGCWNPCTSNCWFLHSMSILCKKNMKTSLALESLIIWNSKLRQKVKNIFGNRKKHEKLMPSYIKKPVMLLTWGHHPFRTD